MLPRWCSGLTRNSGGNGVYRPPSNQLYSKSAPYEQAGEPPNVEADALGLETNYEKRTYQAPDSEVGMLRSERDGYKDAYETLNAAIGTLRSERDGYKQTYETLNSEIGILRSERDGYKQAYETLSAEVGHLRILAGPAMVRSPQQAQLGAGKPSILIASLPKSGTVYVGSSLAATLNYDYSNRSLTSGTFPKDIVWPHMAQDFARGGMISTSHLQAESENLRILKRNGITKGILQTRDPRAALHSWAHFYKDRELYKIKDPFMGEKFTKFSSNDQIDFHIDEFFSDAIAWLSAWLDVLDKDSGLNFLMLTYEDLAKDAELYIRTILDFYNLDAPIRTALRGKQTHFRSGKTDEWRTGLSAHHIRRMNELIPNRLWQRLGWRE